MPPAMCPTCEQIDTAVASLISQKPKEFVFASNELLSGQVLYDRSDLVNTYEFSAGLDHIESVECKTCRSLVNRITETTLWKEDPETISTLKSLKMSLSGPMCERDCFVLDVSVMKAFCLTLTVLQIQSAKKTFQFRIVPSDFANSSSSPPSLVELNIIQSWIQICDAQHAGKCHSYMAERPICRTNMRMIDVIESCVVKVHAGEPIPKYAALSYVWGKVETLLCIKANCHALEAPGSMEQVPLSSKLARTIKDAMKLTKSLGLRYLWADMICIIQDDPSDKEVQLPNMANIYGEAYFTIVAADANDAQGGIAGVSSDHPRMPLPLLSFRGSASRTTFAIRPDAEESREKVWHTRAWTLQERALSRRTLMFLDRSASWACMQASFDEETFISNSNSDNKPCYYCQASRVSDTTTLSTSKWPDFENYARLASLFTERQLTCADDILNAFTGILVALQPTFPNGFLQGLPEFFFDVALLWRRIDSNFTHLPLWPSRRCLKPGKKWASTHFASWSWAGWQGCRAQWYPIYNDAVDYDMEIIPITPEVSWLKLSELNHSSAVRNDFHAYRMSSLNGDNKLEKGWTKAHEGASLPGISFGFTHPKAPSQRFNYQLPIADDLVQHSQINHGTGYLTFRTKVCRFTFRKEVFNSPYLQGSMYTADETWVGIMHDILTPVSHGDLEPLACEVVCLSSGFVNINRDRLIANYELEWVEDALPEVKIFSRIRDTADVYHFYNVMWLAWEDGIAYRRGLGRVWKPMWGKQRLKEMDVVLG